jgi:hypothetical protein
MQIQPAVSKIFEKSTVELINNLISHIDDPRWVLRNYLPPGRGVDGASCSYLFCGHAQMPVFVKNKLTELAPNYADCELAEIAINRYRKGDYLGKHRDRHLYRKNLVVSLQENGDGLMFDDTDIFVEDSIGQGILFEGVGPSHSVPPVKTLRHSLIYLYE